METKTELRAFRELFKTMQADCPTNTFCRFYRVAGVDNVVIIDRIKRPAIGGQGYHNFSKTYVNDRVHGETVIGGRLRYVLCDGEYQLKGVDDIILGRELDKKNLQFRDHC